MKAIQGKIVAGERKEVNVRGQDFTVHSLTVETYDHRPQITMGAEVLVTNLSMNELADLRTLRYYLKDRPALTDDKEVKDGIHALNTILGTPIEDL